MFDDKEWTCTRAVGVVFVSLDSKMFFVSVLLIVLLTVPLLPVCAANEDDAIQVIDQAEEAVTMAYEAVSEAEEAGANVSLLLDRLNVAGEYLAEANMLFRLGDFDGSVYSAGLASEQVGEDFAGEADGLRVDAEESERERWFTNIIISVVGVIAVVLGTSVTWLIFKRRSS